MFGKEKDGGDQPLAEEQPLRMDSAGGKRDMSKAALLVAVLAVILTVVLFVSSKGGGGVGEEALTAIKATMSETIAAQEAKIAALEAKVGSVDVVAQMKAQVAKQRLAGMHKRTDELKGHLTAAGADPADVDDKVAKIKDLLTQLEKYGNQ